MKTIYKYEALIADKFTIKLNEGYEILTLKMQDLKPCLWVLVETNNPIIDVEFEYFGTGYKIGEQERKYIGTIMFYNDNLVYHLFETVKLKS